MRHDWFVQEMVDHGVTYPRTPCSRTSTLWNAPVFHYRVRRGWTRDFCEKMVRKAIDSFRSATCVNLPWDLEHVGPWKDFDHGIVHGDEHADRMLTTCARLCGFLNSIAASPGRYRLVIRLLKRTLSERGVNSPCTHLDLYRVLERFSSPGRLQTWLIRVIRHADAILRPRKVSWRALGYVISNGPYRPNRAAKVAAARTTFDQVTTHRQAISLLCHARLVRRAAQFLSAVTEHGERGCLTDCLAIADLIVPGCSITVVAYGAILRASSYHFAELDSNLVNGVRDLAYADISSEPVNGPSFQTMEKIKESLDLGISLDDSLFSLDLTDECCTV